MDQALHKVSISGSTLAHLLQNFSASFGDCDGILFGHIHTEVFSRIEDDDEQCGLREEINAVITGFCSSGSSLSFYDACGLPDPGKLSKLLGHKEEVKGEGKGKEEKTIRKREGDREGRDPMIGWFVGRRNTPLRPSLREMAVTKGLVSSRIHNHGGSSTVGLAYNASVSSSNTKESTMSSPQSGNISSPIDVDSSPSDGGNRLNPRSGGDRDTGTSFTFLNSSVPSFQSEENMEHTSVLSPKGTGGKKIVPNYVVSDPPLVQFNGTVKNQAFSPFLFMLLTESGTDEAIHTHDYRVYQYHIQSQRFEPRMLKIVNIGPAFRGNYDSFSPVVPFPLFPLPICGEGEGQSDLHKKSMLKACPREEHDSNRKGPATISNEQALVDVYTEGYKVENLERILELNSMQQVPALEDLYSKMLLKLRMLAKQVSDSSSVLLKQALPYESKIFMLRESENARVYKETYNAHLRKDAMEI